MLWRRRLNRKTGRWAGAVGMAAVLAAWHVVGLRADHEEKAQRLTANAAAVVDRYVQARVDALAMLALSPLADDLTHPGGLYREAQAFRASFDSDVVLASPDRRALFDTGVPLGSALPPVPRPEGHSAIQDALDTGRPAVGDLFAGPAPGTELVAIAAPGVRHGRTEFLLLSLAGAHQFERSLAQMTVDDVRAFHDTVLRPSETTLVAVGDCDHDTIHRLASDAFADWHGHAAAPALFGDDLPTPARLNVIPRSGAPQSELRIGHVAVPRNTPDYHALVAANMVLGGQFVSRLNLNLREDKGFTYGVRTSFDFRQQPGPFTLQVSVHTAATGRAIEESIAEIGDIRGRRPVTGDELAMGVAALTRGYARNFETAEQIARAVTQLVLHDLPDDYFANFVPAVERITPDDVMRAAERHLHPERLTTLIVGDLDAIGASLATLGLGEPVVLPAGVAGDAPSRHR